MLVLVLFGGFLFVLFCWGFVCVGICLFVYFFFLSQLCAWVCLFLSSTAMFQYASNIFPFTGSFNLCNKDACHVIR